MLICKLLGAKQILLCAKQAICLVLSNFLAKLAQNWKNGSKLIKLPGIRQNWLKIAEKSFVMEKKISVSHQLA